MEIKQSLKNNDDYIIEILASNVKKCRHLVQEIKKSRNNLAEFFLAFSTLSIGGVLGAWQGGIDFNQRYWWVFYIILPTIATGCLVTYGFLSHYHIAHPAQIAQRLLEELPNPGDTKKFINESSILAGTWCLESRTNSSNKTSSGEVNLTVNHGKISMSGIILGQNDNKIGEVTSLFCNYDSEKRQLIVIYRLFVANDDKRIVVNECIFSGIVFIEENIPTEIKGNWQHLYQNPVSGIFKFLKIKQPV